MLKLKIVFSFFILKDTYFNFCSIIYFPDNPLNLMQHVNDTVIEK